MRYVLKLPYSEGITAVQRINLSWYSQLGVALRPLAALGSVEKLEWQNLIDLHGAKAYLDTLSDRHLTVLQLRACRAPLQSLMTLIQQILEAADWITAAESRKWAISYWAQQLDPILQGELGVQNSYIVRPKRAYDIELLIEDATHIFSDAVRVSLASIERYDIQQAGKCLAFEVPTAALFHVFRAADSVLRRYYRHIMGSEPQLKMRNWGAYIKKLRGCGANEKILSALEQMKDLHRNPIVHPEAEASMDEALSYIGIAESVISVMVLEIVNAQTNAATGALTAALALVSSPVADQIEQSVNGPPD